MSFGVENIPPIGSSPWTKVIVGAVVTPFPVAIVAVRVMVATYGKDASFNPMIALAIASGSAFVGACLGGLLAAKDRVAERMLEGQAVAFPLRMLFGYGLWSLLAVWFPIILFGVILLMPLALLVNS